MRHIQRAVEVILAIALLVFVSPVLLIAIVTIKATSAGPALFKASRMGRHQVPFTMYKLRSMTTSQGSANQITALNDDRITSVGKYLRKFKIDELPQLVNIIRGEMAVIGPRPESVSIVETHYTNEMLLVFRQTPGLISPGTLYNENQLLDLEDQDQTDEIYVKTILPKRVALDIEYEETRTLKSDLKLIWATIAELVS